MARLLYLALALCLLLVFFVPYSFRWDSDLPKLGTVPEFSFVNQDGGDVGHNELSGKVWVVNFFFSRCKMICPVVNAKVAGLQSELSNFDKNLRFVSISVDPEYDTVSILSEYRKKFSQWNGIWHFLTGDKAIIYQFSREVFKFDNSDKEQHTTKLVLVDKSMNIRGYYSTDDLESLAKLKLDIKGLL